jgi:condensin complex subunit 2
MIFDSGDAAITEDGSVPVQPLVTESVDRDFLELDSLTFSIFNDDSAPQFICPSLKDFQLGQDTTLDLNNLKPYEAAENEDDDYEGDIKFESDSFFQTPPDFDGEIDLPLDDFNEPNFMDNINGDGFEGNENNLNEDGEIDSEKPNYPTQASLTSNENIFSYFDDNINKGWAGPEHWRVKGNKNKEVKNKEANEGSGTTTKTKSKAKSKEDEFINFSNYDELDLHTLFTPSKGTINNPKLHESESSNYLLPDDLHFTSKTFMNLFVKPKFQLKPITNKSRGYDENDLNVSRFQVVPEDSDEININESGSRPGSPTGQDQIGDMDFDMDIGNEFDQDNDQPIDVYSDEEEIPPTQFNDAEYSHLNLGDQLIPELRKVESVSINYMKINKRVDVKKLKSNLWRELEELKPLPDPQTLESHFQAPSDEQTQQKTFSTVCQSLKSHYPKRQFQDISVPFCFISLLHLANEEGLKLEGNSNLNELVITKE